MCLRITTIRTSTDVDDARDDTGATQGETDTGTQEETEDATLRGPNGVLIRCEGTALTLPGGELTSAEGSIPPGLRRVTLT